MPLPPGLRIFFFLKYTYVLRFKYHSCISIIAVNVLSDAHLSHLWPARASNGCKSLFDMTLALPFCFLTRLPEPSCPYFVLNLESSISPKEFWFLQVKAAFQDHHLGTGDACFCWVVELLVLYGGDGHCYN